MSRFLAAVTSPLVLIWRRARSDAPFLAALFAGVLLATAVLAGSPLYLNALSELGLRHALQHERTGVLDAAVLVPARPPTRGVFTATQTEVRERVGNAAGPYIEADGSHLAASAMWAVLPEESIFAGSIRGRIQSFDAYEERVRVLEGRLPRPGAAADGGAAEVVLGANSARSLQTGLSGRFTLSTGRDGAGVRMEAVVVGIVEPLDRRDRYWQFVADPFSMQTDFSTGEELPMVPLVAPHETFFTDLTRERSTLRADYWFYFFVDGSAIEATEAGALRESMTALEDELPIRFPGATVLSGLTRTLERYEDKLFFSRIPVLIMAITVSGVALFYLVVIGNAAVERQLSEIALFRSRGANGLQAVGIYLWQALVLSAAAVGAGPLLAWALVPQLGRAPPFENVTAGAPLPAEMTASVWIFALIGGVLAFAALAAPALKGARFNVLDARSAAGRPGRFLGFHRYYLDVFLLAVTGLLYWELTQRGSLVTQRLFGEDSIDELLLAAPVLLMASLALLILRAAPYLLDAASFVVSRFSTKAWPAIGLWTLARSPAAFLRPALIVSLTAGMGMFAASYHDTIERSFSDRGLYFAGSDARLVGLPRALTADADIAAAFESYAAVDVAGAVYRSGSGALVSPYGYQLLAVDTLKFHRVSWYREDFSDTDLFTLLRKVEAGRSILRGLDLPEGTTRLGVWIRPDQEYQNRSLWARVRDGAGVDWRFRLGRLDYTDWRYLETEIGTPRGPIEGPLTLQSLFIFELDFPEEPLPIDVLVDGFSSSGRFNLSDLTATTGGGRVVVDALDSTARWGAMATSQLVGEVIETDREVTRGGSPTLELSWQAVSGVGRRGIYPTDHHEPLPVIGSESFLAQTGRLVGDTVDVRVAGVPMPVTIVDSIQFFPTLDPSSPFVLGSLDTLLHYANLFRGAQARPNEVWLSLSDDEAERAAFLDEVGSSPFRDYVVIEGDAELLNLVSDPLVGVGSRGVSFSVLLVLAVLTAGGYLGYTYAASFRWRREFAVLRALGLSGRGNLLAHSCVHAAIIGVGALIGALVGSRAHAMMITFLEHTERGRNVLPPFAPQTDWSGVGWIALAAAGAALALLVWAALRYAKTQAWRTLREGSDI